ncbi:TPA: hypothetical protein DEO28_04820 [Candidatus Dependentiae bacterium]|nr:MAG: putative amino acid permease [candidate division TM6 bacterium GW2011_GWE2_31_21]KKP53874.1 MAG: putative amino acid permease [candidate division TM6 bacterium GW2011_GWF2_33_332]HBS47654.1 hypothetical protein [Candidatus Dependentiae bacterium]HBZ73803.1 hypothetical protein [Candidatus Dependentiae bacterium]
MPSNGSKLFSLWFVIAISINVILGAGIFVNSTPLAQLAGPLGFLSYIIVALIVLPLVLSIAELSKIHKATEGGFYTYSKEGIGRWAGNISAFAYFLGKIASISVLFRTISTYFYNIFPSFEVFPIVYTRIILLILLVFLNLLGVKIGGKLQIGFIFLKFVPITLVILLGIFYFNFSHLTFQNISFSSFASSVSIAIYALMGFEAACLIGHTIDSAEKNISKAVVFSFLIVATVCMLFQNSIFGVLGTSLAQSQAPVADFFAKIPFIEKTFGIVLPKLISGFVMLSILGAAYGMIFVNSWNIFSIVKESKFKSIKKLTSINKHGAPYLALIFQGFLVLFFLTINVNVLFIARIAILGILTSYTFSATSLLMIYKTRGKEIKLPKFVAVLSLFSCAYIGINCIKDLIYTFKNFF